MRIWRGGDDDLRAGESGLGTVGGEFGMGWDGMVLWLDTGGAVDGMVRR